MWQLRKCKEQLQVCRASGIRNYYEYLKGRIIN